MSAQSKFDRSYAVLAALALAVPAWAGLTGPSLSKSFAPSTIGPGSTSTLSFHIDNSDFGTPVSDVAFTDNLPAGVVLASPPIASTDCIDAVVSAPPGGSTVSMAGGRLGGFSTCQVTVNVTSAVVGTHMNVTSNLTSSAGTGNSATADLVVAADRAGFSKSFTPPAVTPGAVSTLTFTVDNTAGAAARDFLAFSDPLPAGLVVASPANASTNCVGQFPPTVTAVSGSSTISLVSGSVGASSSCTLVVDVQATIAGVFDNLTSNLTWSGGGIGGKATASLTSTLGFLNKTFTDDPVPPGGSATLEFTITQLDAVNAVSGITFTDDLDATLSGLVAVGLPLADPCGPGSSLTGTSLLTLTGGNLPAGGACTFDVALQVPAGAVTGSYPNTTSTVSATVGGSPVVKPAASDTLVVQPIPVITKSFTDDPVAAGSSVTLEFSLTNTSATSSATSIAFIDDLGAVAPGLAPTMLPANDFCGAGSVIVATSVPPLGQLGLSMTGGSLAPAASCTFSVTLAVPAGLTAGPYTNVTGPVTAIVDAQPVTGRPATDVFEVLAAPRLQKSFTNDPVQPGSTVTLEFTLEYGQNATVPTTAITFTDDLSTVLAGLTAVGLPANDVCGVGSVLSGSALLTLTGGNLMPGESCTFPVTLQVPAAALPGSYLNTTSGVGATSGGQAVSSDAASDSLQVAGLGFGKAFTDDPVIPGATVTLQFSIVNQSPTAAATNLAFTDTLGAALPGLVAVGLPASDVCGAGSQIGGTGVLTLSGGSLAAGTSCTFNVTLQVPAGAAPGEYVNTTSSLAADFDGSPVTAGPASDTLTVLDALSLGKSFADDPASPGGTVTLAFTIVNTHPSQSATALAFSDDLTTVFPGLVAVGLPANDVCGAGSQLSGTGVLTLGGGSLPPGGTCTFNVTLQLPASLNSNVTNVTSPLTGMLGGVPAGASPATDVLQVAQADIGVTHTLEQTDPVAPHGSLAYRLLIANAGPGEAPNVRLADTLPAGTTFVSSNPGTPACSPGPGTLQCNLGTLLSGTSTSVDIVLSVDQPTSGVVGNVASVSSDALDGAAANNTSSENTTVVFVKGDFNYDARTDLVLRNGVTNETRNWLMNDSVRESTQTLSPALALTQVVGGTDDFDGDRRTDLALRDTQSGAVEFWPLDGATLMGSPVPLTGAAPLPAEWKLAGSADFNADGRPDLLWRNDSTQRLLVWTLNGTQYLGDITPSPDLAINANWEVVGALDFNGDGPPDLLWYNSSSGKLVLWFMDANVVRITGLFTNPANAGNNNWKVLAAGDYGLGLAQTGTPVPGSNDVVWRNFDSGRFVIWHLDLAGNRTGGAFTTPLEPEAPPTDWIIVGPR